MIALLIAIFTYLAARKNGASSSQALLAGAGAGLATHYVTKNTEWGRDNIQPLNDKIASFLGFNNTTVGEGGTVLDENGKPITVPEGYQLVRYADGSASLISTVTGFVKSNPELVSTIGGVVATTSLADKALNFIEKNWVLVLGALGLWLTLRSKN